MSTPLEIALQEYGTKEILGPSNNKKVVDYFKAVGHSWVTEDQTPWCSAFVGYCLEKAGIKSTKKLNAKSYLKWGEATEQPQIGDVVVFWRVKKNGPYGHVGFYINETANTIRVLGGNQANEVNIQSHPKSQLLSYRTYDRGISLSEINIVLLAKELIKRLKKS